MFDPYFSCTFSNKSRPIALVLLEYKTTVTVEV
jgi:hypothetical protein